MNAIRFIIAFALLLLGVGTVDAQTTRFKLNYAAGGPPAFNGFFTDLKARPNGSSSGVFILEVWTTGECTGTETGTVPAGVSAVVFHSPSGNVSFSRTGAAATIWDNLAGRLELGVFLLGSAQNTTTCVVGPDPGVTNYQVKIGNMIFSSAEVKPSVIGWSSSQNRVDFQVLTIPANRAVTCTATPPQPGDMLSARLFGSPVAVIKQAQPVEGHVVTVGEQTIFQLESYPAGTFLCTDFGMVQSYIFSDGFD